MNKLLEFIKEKRFEMIVIAVLIIVLFAAIPSVIQASVDNAISRHLDPINDYIMAMDSKIDLISERHVEDITERGIAAYKKIYTIEDLQNNTQNAISIKIALKTPSARNILYSIDSERTMLFEDYFFGSQG
jgi:outer membrane phospholipase A